MSESIPNPFETVIYPGHAYAQTHPDHVGAMACLCGLDPALLETCRVLEVACGDASNLIPMAMALPRATFRGFDLAPSPIERGKTLAHEIGITNLALEQLDITQAPDCMGEFDYLIAHGFYSWVPQAARDKLMAICRASLAPHGVAFISYNTFPGGHIRSMVRDMMLFHVERAPDAQTKISQARALLGFLSKQDPTDDEYRIVLKKEFERVLKCPPGHLYHDELAPFCESFYFHEFISRAAEHDLQFLADLNSTLIHVEGLDAEAAQALSELETDPILREQYLDFFCCRRFRQTLLCHAGLRLDRRPNARRLEALLVSSPAARVSKETKPDSNEEEEFHGARNASLKTSHPMMKAAMRALNSAWPEYLSMDKLRELTAARLDVSVDSIPSNVLAEGVLAAFTMRVLDLHLHSPGAINTPGGQPRTSPLVRWQARNGSIVTNLLHESMGMEGDGLRLLALLDGHRNRAQLAADWPATPAEIDEALGRLTRLAFLEA
jgi:methyltransferase-like protein/SAM-dependent methyltransferase